MAETISLSINGVTRSATVPDGTSLRIANAYRTLLGLDPASTSGQVMTALTSGIFQGIKANVLDQERAAARVTADASIADILIT